MKLATFTFVFTLTGLVILQWHIPTFCGMRLRRAFTLRTSPTQVAGLQHARAVPTKGSPPLRLRTQASQHIQRGIASLKADLPAMNSAP